MSDAGIISSIVDQDLKKFFRGILSTFCFRWICCHHHDDNADKREGREKAIHKKWKELQKTDLLY